MAKTAKAPRVNKTETVRQAVEQLGMDTSPSDLQVYIKDQHGIEMSLNHISNIKSGMKKGKRGRKLGLKPGKRGSRPLATEAPTLPNGAADHDDGGASRNGYARPAQGSVSLADLVATKALAERYGAEPLKRLVELVGT